MAQLIIRNLDEDIKHCLQERAARHGRSLEDEIREIFRAAAYPPAAPIEPLGTRIARRFAGIGPTEPLEKPSSQPARPAIFDD